MSEGLTTSKATRQKNEKKAIKDGKDTPFPGWDAIRKEEREEKPQVVLTVRNSNGQIVRRVTGPAKPGFHRVAWDLSHDVKQAWQPPRRGGGYNPFAASGFLAAPGDYSVTFGTLVNGEFSESGDPQTFTVKRLGEPALKGASPQEMSAFLQEVEKVRGELSALTAVMGETKTRLEAIKAVLKTTPEADPALYKKAHDLLIHLAEMELAINGSELHDAMGEPTVQSISSRFSKIVMGTRMSTYGPTPNLIRSYEIAKKGIEEQKAKLGDIVNKDLPSLEKQLDEVGAPWTPGRSLK